MIDHFKAKGQKIPPGLAEAAQARDPTTMELSNIYLSLQSSRTTSASGYLNRILFSEIESFCNVFYPYIEVSNRFLLCDIMMCVDEEIVSYFNNKAEKDRKRQEKKQSSKTRR